jgi:hypothetical protein
MCSDDDDDDDDDDEDENNDGEDDDVVVVVVGGGGGGGGPLTPTKGLISSVCGKANMPAALVRRPCAENSARRK